MTEIIFIKTQNLKMWTTIPLDFFQIYKYYFAHFHYIQGHIKTELFFRDSQRLLMQLVLIQLSFNSWKVYYSFGNTCKAT